MKFKTKEERLDWGLCPNCETELKKYEYNGGPLGDDSSFCPKCKWKEEL